jgi:hypothetical protein
MTDEVKRLCNEIKRLVPPKIAQASTGPFDEFVSRLKDKITPQEMDSIHRAYNYFNQLVKRDMDTPVVAEPKVVNPGGVSGLKKDEPAAKKDEPAAKRDDKGGEDSREKKDDKGGEDTSLSPKPTQLENPGASLDEKASEEMITILVELMNQP